MIQVDGTGDQGAQGDTYQLYSLLGSLFSAESDKGITSVQATERVHH